MLVSRNQREGDEGQGGGQWTKGSIPTVEEGQEAAEEIVVRAWDWGTGHEHGSWLTPSCVRVKTGEERCPV